VGYLGRGTHSHSPIYKNPKFGGVSLNKFELSRGVCYIIFQILGYPTNFGPRREYPT
jgi:hypothetical protein